MFRMWHRIVRSIASLFGLLAPSQPLREILLLIRSISSRIGFGRSTKSSGLHPQQLDIEDQRRVGRDDAAGAARAVAELGRDDQRAFAADFHPGDALVPPFDDLAGAEPEAERRAAIDRAVEFLALVPVR